MFKLNTIVFTTKLCGLNCELNHNFLFLKGFTNAYQKNLFLKKSSLFKASNPIVTPIQYFKQNSKIH